MQQETIPVIIAGETRYLKAEMVKKLARGQVTLHNDFTDIDGLLAIMSHAFPADPSFVAASANYYYRGHHQFWSACNLENEYQPAPEPISAFFAEPPVEAVAGKRELTDDEYDWADYHSKVFAESMNEKEPYSSGLQNGYVKGWAAHAASTPSPAELQQQADLVKKYHERLLALFNTVNDETQQAYGSLAWNEAAVMLGQDAKPVQHPTDAELINQMREDIAMLRDALKLEQTDIHENFTAHKRVQSILDITNHYQQQ